MRTNNEAFRVPGSTIKPVPGNKPQTLHFAERGRVSVRHTANNRRDTAGPLRKSDLFTNRKAPIFFRDDVPMRINVWVAKLGRDPVLQAFRDVVLKTFRLVMNFIPGKIEHIMKESFEQTMMAQDLCSPALPHLA